MTILSGHNLTKTFGERVLFEGLSFEVDERDKVGLVGPNGCGKTTLFKMLIGESSIDGGQVVKAKTARIGYMEQHVCSGRDWTLFEEVESVFAPVKAVEAELARVNAELMQHSSLELIERQHQLQEQLTAMGGLYYQNRVRATLLGLGFEEAALEQPVSSLSGGQKSKAALARLLLSDANLLLLDEPTNHLDIPSVEWLEEFLRNYTGAAIIISHDRYFLDKVANRTFEISGGKLHTSNGSYTFHKQHRDKEKEVQQKHYKTAMREIERLEEVIDRFRQFNREKSIRQAESKQKQLDKLKQQVEVPEAEQPPIRFDFTASAVSGMEVLMAEGLSMGFGGRRLFEKVDFKIFRGERVFLLGPNGCGKTTLLKLLNGQLTPWSGQVRLGAKVQMGYYDQTQSGLSPHKTVFEEISDSFPHMTGTDIRNALAAFLFRGDEVFQMVGQLSGGERARVLLLKLMLKRHNLLLLDEPTNHLDIQAREALEEALLGYDGTLFIVSHDRYFINRLATRVLRLTEQGCLSFPGNYDEYLEKFQAMSQQVPAPAEKEPPKTKVNPYLQRKELQSEWRRLTGQIRRTEQAIAEAEQQIAAIQAQMADEQIATDYQKMLELTEQLHQVQQQLDNLMEQWTELQRRAEQLEPVEPL